MDADIQDILASASRARNDAAMQLGRPTASSCAAATTTMKELDLPKLDYKEIYEVLESSGKARRLGDSVLQIDVAPTTTTTNNDAASSTGEPVRRSFPLDVDLSSDVNEILERRQQQQRPIARTPTQDRASTDAMSTVDEEVRRRLVDSSVVGTTTSPLSSISPHNVAFLANNTSNVSTIDQEASRRLRNAIPMTTTTTTTLSSAMPDRSNTYSNGTSLSSNSVTGITTKVHGLLNRMRLPASSVRGQSPLRPLTNPTPATPTIANDRNNTVNTVNVNHAVRAERADINDEVKRILEESSMVRRAAGIATHGPTGATNNSNTNAVFTATPINYINQPTTIQNSMSALTSNSPGRGSPFHNTTTSLPGIRENPRSTSNDDRSLPPAAYQSLTRSLSLEDYPPHRRRNDGFAPLHTSQSYDDHHRSGPPPSPFPPVTGSRSYLSASSPSRSATRDTGTSRYDETTNRYDDSTRHSHDPSRTTTGYKRTIVTERTSVDESSEFSGETPVSFATSNITMNWGTSWCCCVSLGPDAPCWARAALNIACFLCTLLGFLLLAFVAVSIARGEVLFFSFATSTLAPTVSPEPTSSPTTSPPTTSRPTRHPTYDPTKRPSPFPTTKPTRGPTDRPTWHPTQRPTPFPTAFPTTSPPTAYPTTSPPTKDPTPNPSFSLTPTTSPPTLSPTKSSATVFYVTGGFFPGSQLFNEFRDSEFITELKEAHRDGAAFVVHLGNFNDPDRTACDERFYRDVERVSVVDRTSNRVVLPVLFVNGADDYVRCPNPYQAFSYWAERLGSIERTWPDYDANVLGGVKRMDGRPENFSFVHKRVLFLGLDVVTGDVDAVTDQRKRDADNAWWVRERVTRHYDDVDAVVLFGNEAPDANDHRFFFRTLIREVVDEAQLPTVYFYSSDREWSLRRPFDSDYFTALNVRESRFPFLETVVDPKGRMLFRFDQAS